MFTPGRVVRRWDGLASAWLAAWTITSGSVAQTPRPADRAPAAALDRYGDPLPRGAVFRLGTVRYRQDSPIYRITFTPDGKRFITDGQDSILRVWDAATGRMIRRIDPQVALLRDYQLTSRGQRVLALGTSVEPGESSVEHVTMVELETGRVVDRADWKELFTDVVAICADRQYVAVALPDEGVRVLDAWTKAEIVRWDVGRGGVKDMVFSRDGLRLAAATPGDGSVGPRQRDVHIFGLAERRELRTFPARGSEVVDLTFSPDGATVAGAVDSSVFVGNVQTGERRFFDYVRSAPDSDHVQFRPVSYSGDGRLLAGLGLMGSLRVFDLKDRRTLLTLETDVLFSTTVALAPDGGTLIANGGSSVLHAWDLKTHRDRFAMPDAHASALTTAFATPDGRMLVTADDETSIRAWDLHDGRQVRKWRPSGVPRPPILAPDGTLLCLSAEAGRGWSLIRWDFAHGGEPTTWPLPAIHADEWLVAAGFADEGRSLLVVDTRGVLRSWDLVENKPRDIPRIQIDTRGSDEDPEIRELGVMKAVFMPGGKRLAASTLRDGTQMIDTSTGRVMFVLPHDLWIAGSPDGRTVAATDYSPLLPAPPNLDEDLARDPAEIQLLDSATGHPLQRIRVQGKGVWAMAFSPDSKTLAATTGWEEGQIHLFDVASGKKVRTIACPPMRSRALTFLPDGRRLVTGMADGSLLVWDTAKAP